MSLKHILLGMLHRPASGYDLKKYFSNSLNHFWAAELSQIYPQLSRLEDDGLLRSTMTESDKGPPRKVYKRTAAGKRELVEWLSHGPHVSEERRHFLAQVFFLHAYSNPRSALDFMKSLKEIMSEKLDTLRATEKYWREEDSRYPDDLPDEDFYPQLTLALGLKVIAATVEWCDACIDRIEQRIAAAGTTNQLTR